MKILKKITSVLKNKKIIAAVALLGVLGVGVWWYSAYALERFTRSYSIYKEKAGIQQNAAFIPGAAENPLRDQLNKTLTAVLTPGTTAKDRIGLAHDGLNLIIQSNTEVDAIGDAAREVEVAANAMADAANSPGNIFRKKAMLGIVALAKQELYTIQDIRGLSYRANFDTAEVFNRLITDEGALTDAYIRDLNTQLPAAENAFIKRQNSYMDLEKQIYDVSQAYESLMKKR